MATDREIKAMLQPLLKRRPELVYRRRLLFVSPLTHYLRGVYFTQSLYAPTVRISSFATPLFDGCDDVNCIPAGNVPPRFHEHGTPFRDDPAKASAILAWIEQDVLPRIERIVDPVSHEEDPPFLCGCYPPHLAGCHAYFRFLKAINHCFFGEFDKAERWLAENSELIPECSAATVTELHKFDMRWVWRAAYLQKLLLTDASRVPILLHEWEEFSVKSNRLEKYWRPTPFPCEL